MRYLSGFRGGEGYLFLRPESQRALVDSRYTTQVKEEAPHFEVIEVGGERGFGDVIAELIQKTGTKRLLFEDRASDICRCYEASGKVCGYRMDSGGRLAGSSADGETKEELSGSKSGSHRRPGV